MYLKTISEIMHEAIHNKEATHASFGGIRYAVQVAPSGCRCIRFNEILFMEQNKTKQSRYAQRAREGEKITWGIRAESWILIDNKGVHIPEKEQSLFKAVLC